MANSIGGFHDPGLAFSWSRKMGIVKLYLNLNVKNFLTKKVLLQMLAKAANISQSDANKNIRGVMEGNLQENDTIQQMKTLRQVGLIKIMPEQELFLLSICAENPVITLLEYCRKLYETYGVRVSDNFVSNIFWNWFLFKGSFWKPNMVPIGKWHSKYIKRCLEFKTRIDDRIYKGVILILSAW